MASNDVAKPLLTWMFGGIGALLVYAAFKTQSPLDILRGVADSGPEQFVTRTPVAQSPSVDPHGVGGIARLRAIANRDLPPTLVDIPGGGKLDIDAANSLKRINAVLGYTVPNVGAYRSYAQQAALYASNPNRFGSPQTSMHVVGLAIDVASTRMNDPKLVAAFTAEGWHRPRGPGTARADEPWHWSFGVSG